MEREDYYRKGKVTLFRETAEPGTVLEAYDISDGELAPRSNIVRTAIAADPELRSLHDTSAWQSHAIQEFADLLDTPLPNDGKFFKVHYLFFEAISTLREAAVCAHNCHLNAAFALMRSSLNQFVHHAWWKQRGQDTRSYSELYEWLEGKRGIPPFKNVAREVFRELSPPPDAATEAKIIDLVSQLNAYAHSPVLRESIGFMSGSDDPTRLLRPFKAWLRRFVETQGVILDFLIIQRPACLFPVDITERFGFSPPAGLFFDRSNVVPLRKALGESRFGLYAAHFASDRDVQALFDWFNSQPRMSTAEVLKTYNEASFGKVNAVALAAGDSVEVRWIQVKATMRTLMRAMAYDFTDLDLPKGPSEKELARMLSKTE